MYEVAAIAVGGAIGSVLRHFSGKMMMVLLGTGFPYGTLFVNITGSFVMGVIVALLAHLGNPSQVWRAFLTVGILGGFTTFSSFSLDVATLYERGDVMGACIYIAASLIVSFAAIFTGMFIVRSLVA